MLGLDVNWGFGFSAFQGLGPFKGLEFGVWGRSEILSGRLRQALETLNQSQRLVPIMIRRTITVHINICNPTLNPQTINPKPYITYYSSFHFLFHYPYVTLHSLEEVASSVCRALNLRPSFSNLRMDSCQGLFSSFNNKRQLREWGALNNDSATSSF